VTQIFVDAGYFIALETSNDQHHSAAIQHWNGIAKSRGRLVTTNFVLDEVVTFFNSRGHHSKAVEIGRRLLDSEVIELVHVDEELFRAAFVYLGQRADKRFSLTDCVSSC
jgi:predicted nucleic acid-binding protein